MGNDTEQESMNTNEITRVQLMVEINEKPYLVVLPAERWPYALSLISSLNDNGKMAVIHAPEGTQFVEVPK